MGLKNVVATLVVALRPGQGFRNVGDHNRYHLRGKAGTSHRLYVSGVQCPDSRAEAAFPKRPASHNLEGGRLIQIGEARGAGQDAVTDESDAETGVAAVGLARFVAKVLATALQAICGAALRAPAEGFSHLASTGCALDCYGNTGLVAIHSELPSRIGASSGRRAVPASVR